ncbi:MAG: DNA repair protein RecN [Anaerolineales bacterium]|nr:DNA repair protein RecN [Anaerolineales bacterium]
MLTELRIENFAIIDQLTLTFDRGLVTLTGETGAGKSIIMDALETLLGGRAESTSIRTGADRASIEGAFQLSGASRLPIHRILEREELLDDPDYLTLGREIRRNNRNVARVNGRSVGVSLMRDIGQHLVDIHGQSEHLSLLHVRQHLELLDRYADIEIPLNTYHDSYKKWVSIRQELELLRQAERDAARRTDLLTYQINEIIAANLKPGEAGELKEEHNRLANAEGLASLSHESLQLLDENVPENPTVTDLLGEVISGLEDLSQIDASQVELFTNALLIFENISDLSNQLRNYQETIEFNPKRLAQVEERIELIGNLKRKYGDSIEAVLAFGVKAQQDLDTITHAGERIQVLEAEQSKLLQLLSEQGQLLSVERHAAAGKLQKAIEAELNDLKMAGAGFQVDFQQRPDPQGVPLPDGQRVAFDVNGLERIEFIIETNPGEGFKPLVKIASGGETSRFMLALKNELARADPVPTLVFDEIDQGIGGRVGTVVGQKLWQLATQHQVMCITHLPQLAAFGHQHYRVEKIIQNERTITQVVQVNGEARIRELAQMLGKVSPGTLKSAQELMDTVQALTAQARP